MIKNLERKLLLQQVEQTLNTCSGCFLYVHHKREWGRTNAHSYCLSSCTVGQQLKILGDRLNQNLSSREASSEESKDENRY